MRTSPARPVKVRITGEIPDRARTGRYAFVHDRGQDFAAGIWVVEPAFMLDLSTARIASTLVLGPISASSTSRTV